MKYVAVFIDFVNTWHPNPNLPKTQHLNLTLNLILNPKLKLNPKLNPKSSP